MTSEEPKTITTGTTTTVEATAAATSKTTNTTTAATSMSFSSTVKRVISNPDEMGRSSAKISKQSSSYIDEEDHLTPAMDSLALGSRKVEEETKLAQGKNTEGLQQQQHQQHVVLNEHTHASTHTNSNNCISNESSALKTAAKTAVARSTNIDINTATATANLKNNDMTTGTSEQQAITAHNTGNTTHITNANIGTGANAKKENDKDGDTSRFLRQVSVDSSTQNNISAPPKVIQVTRTASSSSSVIRNKSESTVGSSTGGNTARDWGWFEDIHDHSSKGGGNKSPNSDDKKGENGKSSKKKGGLLLFDTLVNPLNAIYHKVTDDGTMAVTAPVYVLAESKSSQRLWKHTAGSRPPQPVEERAFYEKVWAENFTKSQVDYQIPADVLTATSPISLSPFADGNFGDANRSLAGPDNFGGPDTEGAGGTLPSEAAAVSSSITTAGFYGNTRSKNRKEALMGPHNHHHTLVNKKVKEDGTDDELTVLVKGDNVFGTTVSKSFPKEKIIGNENGVDTVSISIASYRVVESKKHGKYAQYLVIFCEGTFRDTVGVWKRYSDFERLSRKVSHGHENCTSVLAGIHPLSVTEDPHQEMLPNAITSWNLLKKRKRWYRCLDAGYLSLKAFLLERFLHDICFESTTATILRDFVSDEKNFD